MPLPLPPLPIDGPTALAVVVVPVPLIFGAMAVGDASAGVDLPSSELPLSGPPPAAPSLDMIGRPFSASFAFFFDLEKI